MSVSGGGELSSVLSLGPSPEHAIATESAPAAMLLSAPPHSRPLAVVSRAMDDLVTVSRRLSAALGSLRFAPPVTHVYNPAIYAREPHERYLDRFGGATGRIVLVGMNPGPFGMAQTGVPFGEIAAVRDWLGIDGAIGRPDVEHPKRPVLGWAQPRSEVSGRRLWGWAQRRYGSAEAFFGKWFVLNWCPLCFLEASGRNRTPDKLDPAARAPLFAACDRALRDAIATLQPERVVGVGTFAATRARSALADLPIPVGRILHPSPASPIANQGWAARAEADLVAQGVVVP